MRQEIHSRLSDEPPWRKEKLKLYTDDRIVPYKTTKINPLSTKAEIDGLLARWAIKKTMWEWDLENNKVQLVFKFTEEIEGVDVEPVIKVEPPRIWDKRTRNHPEQINWAISMRVLFWYLKSHLEMAYLMQSSKTTEFLPWIQVTETQTVKDVVIPRIQRVEQLAALPEIVSTEQPGSQESRS